MHLNGIAVDHGGDAGHVGRYEVTDLRAAMSAFALITSASPPKADIPRPTLDFRFCEGFSDACRGWACAANSVGRRPRSLRGRNRGGIRRGGAGGPVYGDLTAAGCLPVVAWPAGS